MTQAAVRTIETGESRVTTGAGAAARGGVRQWAAHFWIQSLVSMAQRAPGLARSMRPVGLWFAWHCSASIRRGTMANAKRLLGSERAEEAPRLARRVVATFYDFLMDMGRQRGESAETLLKQIDHAEGVEGYFSARKAGKGAIIVTAHIGSFEVGAAAVRQREQFVHVVFQRDPMKVFEARRAEQHARLGLIETPVDPGTGQDTWNVWLRLRDALREDHVVLLQGDRVMPGQRGRKVPFMGGHVKFPPGPVKLALATGAPIVPVCAPRLADGRVRIIMEEPIWVHDEPGENGEPHSAELALAKVIEGWVKRFPEQWMMVHPAWCEDQVKA